MKQLLVNPSFAATASLLLTIPAVWFILISTLKYVCKLPGLFEASEPLLLSLGVNQPLGWNINLLFVFGPLLSFLLNLAAILSFGLLPGEAVFCLDTSLQQKRWNWLLLGVSGICSAILFLYAIAKTATVDDSVVACLLFVS